MSWSPKHKQSNKYSEFPRNAMARGKEMAVGSTAVIEGDRTSHFRCSSPNGHGRAAVRGSLQIKQESHLVSGFRTSVFVHKQY